MGRVVGAGSGLMCPQEEESPCGEVTLKRDRSFSEHDLVQLRSEVASGLQPATQPPGGLEPSRPRAGSVHAWRPSTQEQGKCCLSSFLPRICPAGACPVARAPLSSEQAAPSGCRSSACKKV